MLFPALRLMRAQMRLISDPLKLRKGAASVDALGSLAADVRTEATLAGGIPASWVHVQGVRHDCVVLYLHGGAFITKTPVFHGALLARICRASRAHGLMLDYRLSPEHPYPAALDDCVAAYRWLLQQGHDAARIIIAGDSAGGNLTLALLLRLRDEGLPLPAGAVALSPLTDFTFSGESVQRNDGIDDMFSADLMEGLVPVYLADTTLRTHPHVSPVFGNFAGLPPLLLLVGSTELLLDDSVRVAQRWPAATLLVWDGMPHVFAGFDLLPEALEAAERIGRFVRACLVGAAGSAAAASAHLESAEAATPAKGHDAQPGIAPSGHVPARMGVQAKLYLALAGLAGLLCLGVAVWGMGPLLLQASAAVWVSVLSLGTLWAVSLLMFLRSLPWVRTRVRKRRG